VEVPKRVTVRVEYDDGGGTEVVFDRDMPDGDPGFRIPAKIEVTGKVRYPELEFDAEHLGFANAVLAPPREGIEVRVSTTGGVTVRELESDDG